MATNRLGQHGHTVSLAPFSNTSSFSEYLATSSNGVVDNEFGATSSVFPDERRSADCMPPPLSAVGAPAPNNQLDFIRGFGLDVPLESEEEHEEQASRDTEPFEDEDVDRTRDMELDDKSETDETRPIMEVDDSTTDEDSRLHSRHVSRISVALSLRSVGGNFQSQFEDEEKKTEDEREDQDEFSEEEEEEEDSQRPADPAGDWTGSEDLYLGKEVDDKVCHVFFLI